MGFEVRALPYLRFGVFTVLVVLQRQHGPGVEDVLWKKNKLGKWQNEEYMVCKKGGHHRARVDS